MSQVADWPGLRVTGPARDAGQRSARDTPGIYVFAKSRSRGAESTPGFAQPWAVCLFSLSGVNYFSFELHFE